MMSKKSRQRGVIAIETALLLPVLLAVMLMFFDVVRLHLQYGLLESAMRQSLRELITENWRQRPLTQGVIEQMVKQRSFGLIDTVKVELMPYDSLEALMRVKAVNDEEVFRPADPVYRVTATLTTGLIYSPLAYFSSEPLHYRSTLILSQQLLFD